MFGTPIYVYLIFIANAVTLFILSWWAVWGKLRKRSPELGNCLAVLGGGFYVFCALFTSRGVWTTCFLLLLVERVISYNVRQREEQTSGGAVFGLEKALSLERRKYLNPVLWGEVRLLLAQIGIYFFFRFIWAQPWPSSQGG